MVTNHVSNLLYISLQIHVTCCYGDCLFELWFISYCQKDWSVGVNKGPVPRDNESLKRKWTIKVVWSPTSNDEWSPLTGYWRRSGGGPNVLFHNWSSGEVVFLVKSTVQYNEKTIVPYFLQKKSTSPADQI